MKKLLLLSILIFNITFAFEVDVDINLNLSYEDGAKVAQHKITFSQGSNILEAFTDQTGNYNLKGKVNFTTIDSVDDKFQISIDNGPSLNFKNTFFINKVDEINIMMNKLHGYAKGINFKSDSYNVNFKEKYDDINDIAKLRGETYLDSSKKLTFNNYPFKLEASFVSINGVWVAALLLITVVFITSIENFMFLATEKEV